MSGAFRKHAPGIDVPGRQVVSRTPAAELARLKIAFPDWTIRREPASRGGGFVARRKLPSGRWQSRRGATVGELEYELRLLERGGDQPG